MGLDVKFVLSRETVYNLSSQLGVARQGEAGPGAARQGKARQGSDGPFQCWGGPFREWL